MKKFALCTVLSISAFCLLITSSAPKAFATTVQLTVVNGTGPDYGGNFVYPYSFTLNNGGSVVSLMCLSDFTNINIGESWTANVFTPATAPVWGPPVSPVPTSITSADYLAADFLLHDAINNPSNAGSDQWAAWQLFNPHGYNNGFGTLTPLEVTAATDQQLLALSWAGSNPNDTSAVIYIWDGGPITNQAGSDDPQIFIGPVPEPSSLLLLGTGLLGLAVVAFRKAKPARTVLNANQ